MVGTFPKNGNVPIFILRNMYQFKRFGILHLSMFNLSKAILWFFVKVREHKKCSFFLFTKKLKNTFDDTQQHSSIYTNIIF